MKIIFLDIDGVLAIPRTRFKTFAPECTDALKTILQSTGAKIVISSTWRKLHSTAELDAMFVMYGFPIGSIIDSTPNSPNGVRGAEISSWLHGRDVEDYIVIDDEDFDIKEYTDRIVNTKFKIGLTSEDADKAIKMLS